MDLTNNRNIKKMHRALEYALFFVTLLLLQTFLFNNLNLSVYINPLVYVAFVLLLPMELASVWVLLLGLAIGAATDVMTGMAGLNTIAALVTAFSRRQTMMLMIGKESVGEGGIPCSGRIGGGKFVRYISLAVLIHCLIYFSFEALTFSHFYLILLKTALSAALTVTLIWFSQFLLIGTYGKKTTL